MVIDDEEPVRKFITKILARQGYYVLEADNGRKAISLLENEPVDLIMLDMNMPEMNGLDFLRYTRDHNLSAAPVLMVSGSTETELRVESYRLGAYDFITKPEHAEVMLKRIENGLKIGEIIHFNEFMKVELYMAKKLQKYLFPEPELETESLSISTWTKPLSDIGGDLYDYVQFRNGNLVFFVGDVTGHSISAALYTAIVKMVFRNALKLSERPDEIVSSMNRELFGNLPIETFVTMFLGVVDISGMVLHYTNAGHPKPYCLKGDRVEELPGNDSFLGPIRNSSFQTYSIPMSDLDALFVYTDGVLDVLDGNDNPAGLEMLLEVLGDASAAPREKLFTVQRRVSGGEYRVMDDCTMLMLQGKKRDMA
jgi:CheY-like chemotaxis protein